MENLLNLSRIEGNGRRVKWIHLEKMKSIAVGSGLAAGMLGCEQLYCQSALLEFVQL